MTNDRRLELEMRVCRAAIKAGLAKGYVVSVNDGGEWVVQKSAKITQIIAALRSTDSDTIVFRKADGFKVGFMLLVYGNDPEEVIADHSDNPEMDELYREAEAVANRFSANA